MNKAGPCQNGQRGWQGDNGAVRTTGDGPREDGHPHQGLGVRATVQQTRRHARSSYKDQRDRHQFPPQGLGAFEVPRNEVNGFQGVHLSAQTSPTSASK